MGTPRIDYFDITKIADNLVKVTMIIPDAAEIPASRPARAEALGDRGPASTLIVAGLANPAWKIEIEAIACA
jgi:enamine deaminase RidA (YjgF/YER057c/UK114 family)